MLTLPEYLLSLFERIVQHPAFNSEIRSHTRANQRVRQLSFLIGQAYLGGIDLSCRRCQTQSQATKLSVIIDPVYITDDEHEAHIPEVADDELRGVWTSSSTSSGARPKATPKRTPRPPVGLPLEFIDWTYAKNQGFHLYSGETGEQIFPKHKFANPQCSLNDEEQMMKKRMVQMMRIRRRTMM